MTEADVEGPRHPAAPVPPGSDEPERPWLLRNRRQVLVSVGAASVAAAGIGSTVALFTGGHADAVVVDQPAEGIEETPAKAAAAAQALRPKGTNPLSRDPVLHLLRRATFGPKPSTVEQVRKTGIDAWIEAQLQPDALDDSIVDALLTKFPTVWMSTAQIHQSVKHKSYTAMTELSLTTVGRQIWSSRQLYEVMVDFWVNHFNVTVEFDGGWDTCSVFNKDAIRPYALGRFRDMLAATARGPAMLLYLNQNESDKSAVNENYGRELLELHTVGIDGGYHETDVRNSAYLMTGRTAVDGLYRYDARMHWVGPVTIMDFTHANGTAEGGERAGEDYLGYLATHPATATHLARKLAIRFVSDDPPRSLIDRMAKSYLDNETAIAPMLRTMFRSIEFWIATGQKTRRPLENVIACARVLGVEPGGNTLTALDSLRFQARQLGNAPMAWSEPDGYPDVASAWTSAHGMLGVWNAHRALVQGGVSGLAYAKPEQLVAKVPATVGQYVDALAERVLFQSLKGDERTAMLAFLGMPANAKPKNATLDGKLPHLVALLLDTIYHALR